MATFGYRPPVFGSGPGVSDNLSGSRRYRRPQASGVTSALAGRSPLQGGTGYGGFGSVTLPGEHGTSGGVTQRQPQAPAQPQQPYRPPVQQQQAPQPGAYDLDTDPVLQQIQAYTGMGDEQARSAALAQREQLLTNYGDPGLARTVLGENDPYATAAGANPFSTLTQLGQQHGQISHNLDESYNQNNLFYGGARVLGQQDEANAYQAELARQAGLVNQGLGSIDQNLSSALEQNQQARLQAQQDAYSRALQAQAFGDIQNQLAAALAGLGGGTTGGGGAPYDPGYSTSVETPSPLNPYVAATDPSTGYGLTGAGAVQAYGVQQPYSYTPPPAAPAPADDYLQRLALALRRAVAV